MGSPGTCLSATGPFRSAQDAPASSTFLALRHFLRVSGGAAPPGGAAPSSLPAHPPGGIVQIPPLGCCAECCHGCRRGRCEGQSTHQGGSGRRAGRRRDVLGRKWGSGFADVQRGRRSWGRCEGPPWSRVGRAGLRAACDRSWGLGFRSGSQQEGSPRRCAGWGERSLVDFSKDPSGGWWENSPGVGREEAAGNL